MPRVATDADEGSSTRDVADATEPQRFTASLQTAAAPPRRRRTFSRP